MGKASKKKKHGPAARQQTDPLARRNPVDTSHPSNPLEGLRSLNATDRESSCSAIATIFSRLDCRRDKGAAQAANKILTPSLTKSLAKLLLDPVPSVRLQAAGALSNLSAVGNSKICDRMVDGDALTPALAVLVVISKGESAGEAATESQTMEILGHILTMLINVVESSDLAVERLTKSNHVAAIVTLLDQPKIAESAETVVRIVQLLQTAVEGNSEMSRQLTNAPGGLERWYKIIRSSESSDTITARLQAAALLINVLANESTNPGAEEALASVAIPLAETCLQLDQFQHQLDELASKLKLSREGHSSQIAAENAKKKAQGRKNLPSNATEGGSASIKDVNNDNSEEAGAMDVDTANAVGEREPVDDDFENKLRWEWKYACAEPIKLAAEVIVNLLPGAANEETEEGEWGSDDEDAMDCAANNATANGSVACKDGSGVSPIIQVLATSTILDSVLASLQTILSPRNDTEELPSAVREDLSDLAVTLALCAASLVHTLPLTCFGDAMGLWKKARAITEITFNSDPSHPALDPLSGVLWGITKRSPAIASSIVELEAASGASPRLLPRLAKDAPMHEVRVNAIGTLTVIMAGESSSSISDSINVLIAAVEDPHPLVQAEALNAIMDLWGSDSPPGGIHYINRVAKAVSAALPGFKSKVRSESERLGRDARAHLKETALNSARFVKYLNNTG